MNMTDTYILLDKGTISNPPSIYEDHYVTYTTPSPQDKDWSLTFTEASSPPHQYYYAVWRFIDDEEAKKEYPLFRKLAMERNWAPVESRPIRHRHDSHRSSKRLGETQIEGVFYPVYLCEQCDRVFLGATMGQSKFASRDGKRDAVLRLNKWHKQGTL
jgi:hypothetical protein